jgi:hypothetical protein
MNRVCLKLLPLCLIALPDIAREVGTLRMTVTEQDCLPPLRG